MSPTRRDVLKASALSVAAALAGIPHRASVAALPALSTPPLSIPTPAPVLGEIRKVGGILALMGESVGSCRALDIYLDGDLDGTWTLCVQPAWRRYAVTDDGDQSGWHRCENLTANDLMEHIWAESQRPAPTVMRAKPFHRFEEWMRESARRAQYLADWRWNLEHQYGSWRTADEFVAAALQVVVLDAAEMAEFPGFNAVIESSGYFYLAELDWSVPYPELGS